MDEYDALRTNTDRLRNRPRLVRGARDRQRVRCCEDEDLPIYQLPSRRRMRAELNLASLHELLCAQAIDHGVIEQVAARPGQGTVSMFRFGYTAGAIAGLVAGLQLPYSFLLPKIWQKTSGTGPSPDQARKRALEHLPTGNTATLPQEGHRPSRRDPAPVCGAANTASR
jgi:hypothetical protein